jgi:general secretion pathway protein A
MTDYLRYFELRSTPFTKEIDDGDLWLPPSRQAVVEGLCEAIAERDSVLLTGEPGVGKTSILRALRHRLDHSGVKLTYCHNATLGRRDFYRQLSVALGLSAKATAASLFYAVSTHIEELAKERVHPVFLLDEAQLLHQDTLDHLHILLNYGWDSRALLSIVLIGLPELSDQLQLRRNRSLYSRLHRRFQIEPLTPSDTSAYLARQLERVNGNPDVFARDAAALLHEATHGMMRDLNRLASAALRLATTERCKIIDREIVLSVLDKDPIQQEVA